MVLLYCASKKKFFNPPHTSYRWRGERVIEPIKCMLSPHTSYRWRGERVIEPIKCMHSPHTSYRWRGERVIEPIKCMRSPHTSYRWRGERVIEPIKCMRSPHTSYRWRGERVIEPIKCMRSPHTSYRWRRERVIEPIKWMGIIRRPWLTRASGGNLARTPTLYEKCHGILMTTESQELGLTSHPKDGAFWQYSVPINIPGCYDPHRPQGENPLLVSLTSLPTATKFSHPGTDQAQPCLASVGNRSWAAGWYGCDLIFY